MSALPSLFDHHGRPIPVESQLGDRGGEGTVYSVLNNGTLAAKVYHADQRTPERFEKLKAQIALANARLLSVAAWPNGLAFDSRKQWVGFTMPRLVGFDLIQRLYNPVQRLKIFPRASWAFQVRAAMNLAAAFDELHRIGCLMGDVNERNEMVSSQALVRLIDCDSFQVHAGGKPFLCPVGVTQYTPPELQRKSFRGLIRTQNHDRFGLAVLIYQLLFVGRHPYMGLHSDDANDEELIANFRFAQGPMAASWGMAPPPHTPTFAHIPVELGTLFRRAFERGSDSGSRPRPDEWFAGLTALEKAITECPSDPGHRYWRGAGSCVWCRIGQGGRGPEYFFGVAEGIAAFSVDEAKIQSVLQRLQASGPFEFPYDRSRFAPTVSTMPDPLPEGMEEHRTLGIVLACAAGFCCVLALPLAFVHIAIGITALLGALVFGVWLAIHISLSPSHQEYRSRKLSRDHSLQRLHNLECQWTRSVGDYQHSCSNLRASVQKLASQCKGLASQYQRELQKLRANAEAIARVRHLSLHLIADGDIDKIGPSRRQVLASHNIYTAADIEAYKIEKIRGFGNVLISNLLAWKEEVLRRFQFDPNTAVAASEQRSLVVAFRNLQQQVIGQMEDRTKRLEALTPSCRGTLEQLMPQLRQAVAIYYRAETNLTVFKGRSLFFAKRK
ncbi:MAG: hypothetical protein U0793_20315 [Gemmataceae bacterium]